MSKEYIENKLHDWYTVAVQNIENGRTMLINSINKKTAEGAVGHISIDQANKMQDDALANAKRRLTADEEWQQNIIEEVIQESNDALFDSFKFAVGGSDYDTSPEESFSTTIIILEFESRLYESGFLNERH
jgi:hypothetical protein